MTNTKGGRKSDESTKWGRRYPWDDWFKRPEFRLRRKRDYNGRTDTFIQQVRRAATVRRLGIEIVVSDDNSTLTVRVVRDLGPEKRRGRRATGE